MLDDRRLRSGPTDSAQIGILTCPAQYRDHEDGLGILAACLALSLRRWVGVLQEGISTE